MSTISLIRHPFVHAVLLFIVALKLLLMRAYHSTDFEVHRNWMALTHQLPLGQWYHNNVSQWTLDYPPFFAHFEWFLSRFAALLDPAILTLQSDQFFTQNVLIFQRISVICADFCYFISSILLADNFVNSSWAKGKLYERRLKLALFTFLVTNPVLILLDNIHFQYNGFLFGIFLISLNCIFTNHFLQGAFFFAVLLNLKHLYLYYAPAFVGFYLSNYLLPLDRKFLLRTFLLGSVLLGVFGASFGPFFVQGGFDALRQIFSRLFPFKRGLTHACWAPNFWALYNFVDLLGHKLLSKLAKNCSNGPWHFLLKQCPPAPPQYTQGLVQEYDHSVLPSIAPPITLALILVSLTPCFWIFRNRKKMPQLESFLISLTLSAFVFFWFGWHVHEKALLMPFFPLCLLAVRNPAFLRPFALLTVASLFAQFPLFFTPLECLFKWSLALGHFALCALLANWVWAIHPRELFHSSMAQLSTSAVIVSEIYAAIGHRLIFGAEFEFLPMMLCSVACALLVLHAYLSFLSILFGQSLVIQLSKFCCRQKEKRILRSESKVPPLVDIDKVKFVAGVDLSQCSSHQPAFAVVSLVVQSYPEMKVIYAADEIVLLEHQLPYIPEYLAIREAGPIRRTLQRHLRNCPQIQLVLVDGNGRWHSRGCGLACHVGYDQGIPSIGLAKNFTRAPLLGAADGEPNVEQFEQEIERICKSGNNSAAIFQLDHPSGLPELAILRANSSSNPFFVSPGWAVDSNLAFKIALECIHQNPIRLSDLRSRARISEIFEK